MYCKYYRNFSKRVHYWPDNTGMFKALYNADIIPINNKATTSQKWEPSTKSIKYCKHFFNGNMLVQKPCKKSLRICLRYRGDFLVIYKNEPGNFIKAGGIHPKLYDLARSYTPKYLNTILLWQKLCQSLKVCSHVCVNVVDLLKLSKGHK